MERLTYWCEDGRGVGKWFVAIDSEGGEDYGPHIDRLAAYEKTGLEPEEIAKIREDVENGYLKSTARRYGIPVDRLRDLAKADREGRVVVLPRVNPVDMYAFIGGLHDYFEEVSYEDRNVGLFGMSLGEKKLANALMDALTSEEAEEEV